VADERGAVRTVTWVNKVLLLPWDTGEEVISWGTLSRVKPYQIECLTSVEMSILQADQWYQAIDAVAYTTGGRTP